MARRWIPIGLFLCHLCVRSVASEANATRVKQSARDHSLATHCADTDLVGAAIRANPSIEAIDAQIAALVERVQQATAWRDPMLSIEYSNMPIDAWRPGEHPMSGLQINLTQTFPFPGKIGWRKATREGAVREARARLAERKVQLRRQVERAYYRLALVRQLRQVTRAHVVLVAGFEQVVRANYQVGKAGQHELLRLQLLKRKLEDDLERFERDDRAFSAQINAARHCPSTLAIGTPERLEPARPQHDLNTLEKMALQQRPLLERYRALERSHRVAAKQAMREGYPDLTTWIGYRVRWSTDGVAADAGTDFIGVGISVPLPIWYDRRWGTQRRRDEALARAAGLQEAATLDQIRADLARALAGWQRASREAGVYRRELMPMAKRALEATFAAYQVGRADFAALFQSESQLLDFERGIRRAQVATWIYRSEVASLIGRGWR